MLELECRGQEENESTLEKDGYISDYCSGFITMCGYAMRRTYDGPSSSSHSSSMQMQVRELIDYQSLWNAEGRWIANR